MKPLSGKALAAAAAVVVVVTAIVVVVLWWPATRGLTGKDLVTARFDALRIGLNIGVGSGGVIVLYLAWRRQRSTEDTLAHQERVAESTEKDAVERRITDLYTKAADQLGSDKAPVRLAGLYALERLAQDNPAQRRTIVNVLCAYLRMPFDFPGDPPVTPTDLGLTAARDKADSRTQRFTEGDIDRELLTYHRELVQEREVRLTAQRILCTHSRPGPGGADHPVDTYWPSLELDLAGATLDSPDFSNCHIDSLSLTNARINGDARFDGAEFAGDAVFDKAEFAGDTQFDGAKFAGNAWFNEANFAGYAVFVKVKFASDTQFDGTEFVGDAVFDKAKFAGYATFDKAKFAGYAVFDGAKFADNAVFDRAEFAGHAAFDGAKFARGATARSATFTNVPRQFPPPGTGGEGRSVQEQPSTNDHDDTTTPDA
jgi:uncharacterized protein YjbI with pentapeptide repeats